MGVGFWSSFAHLQLEVSFEDKEIMGFLDEFLSCLSLSEIHAQELKTKRGFHQATIEHFGLKSSGLYIKDILARFDAQELKAFKITDEHGQLNYQLQNSNIIIPYYSRSRECVKIRPHKLGFKGDPVMLFSEFSFDLEDENLILTEGEFKAIAGYQWGLNTVAAPGISSFSRDHFDELKAFLNASKVKNITVMFDKEIKHDPKLPNFKKDWKNRYDTDIYAIIMARKLSELGYNTRIATLPADWMVNGKVDMDGALSQGRTKEDILKVVHGAVTSDEHLKRCCAKLEFTHKKYIKNRLAKFDLNLPIRRNNNRYWFIETNDDNEDSWIPLTNFVIDIQATYINENNQKEREIVITNEYQERSVPMVLESDSMVTKAAFNKFCFSQGNYLFTGNEKHLMMIWQWEFTHDEGNMIFEVDHVGKLDSSRPELRGIDAWIFNNVMIINGKLIYPDEDEIFWWNSYGFKIKDIADGTLDIPQLHTKPIDTDALIQNLYAIGGSHAKILLGWTVFCAINKYMKDIDTRPFPFLYGEKASGKSTLAKFVMCCAGIVGVGLSMPDATKAGMNRLASFYSSLPLWFDEFDNSKATQQKESHLKAIYNGVPVVKGDAGSKYGVTSYRIRALLMLSGETLPEAEGLRTRCLLIHQILHEPNMKAVRWLSENAKTLSFILFDCIMRKDEMIEKFRTIRAILNKHINDNHESCDMRTVDHYSIMGAAYLAYFNTGSSASDEAKERETSEFLLWMDRQINAQRAIVSSDHVSTMFGDMSIMRAEGILKSGYACRRRMPNGKTQVYFWLNGVYAVWRRRFGEFKEIPSQIMMTQLFKKQQWLIESGCNRRIDGNARRVEILDYDKIPQDLKLFVDNEVEERVTDEDLPY